MARRTTKVCRRGSQVGILRPRPVQPSHLDPRGPSDYLEKVDPAAANRRARGTPASTRSARTPGLRATRPRSASDPARKKWSSSCWSMQRTAPRTRSPRRQSGARRIFLRRAERAAGENAEEYYRTMFRGRVSSGICATATWRETAGRAAASARTASRRRSSSGRTTRTSATRAPPIWASRRVEPRATDARAAIGRRHVLDRLHDLRRDGHRRLGLGRPAERKRVGPRGGQLRGVFHDTGLPRFLLHLQRRSRAARCRDRAWSAPSA